MSTYFFSSESVEANSSKNLFPPPLENLRRKLTPGKVEASFTARKAWSILFTGGKTMPKMNEGLMLLLPVEGELEDEEIEAIETALDKEQQEELEQALQALFDERDEFSSSVNKAVETLKKIIIALAPGTEEEEEEEEGGKKKVKKSPSWGFTLVPPKED